jgi:triacylglycerol lipase
LVRFLHRQGIAAYALSPQPSDGTAPIEELTQQLAEMIAERFPADTRLNLVGFSMGGLICRCYVQQLGNLGRTARLITIATPHQGTWTAYTYNRPACLQMRPGSRFLAELNRELADLQKIQFTSIWTPFDLTILPPTSSCLPIGEMAPVLSPFHATLLLDPRILQIIAQRLQQPE